MLWPSLYAFRVPARPPKIGHRKKLQDAFSGADFIEDYDFPIKIGLCSLIASPSYGRVKLTCQDGQKGTIIH